MGPDGVFLSNGPGDPSAVDAVPGTIADLLGRVPVFGICMGHQMLATALGGTTYKLPFGHHGGNHPVRDLTTGKVEITSQNHNYCVDLDGVENVEVTHRNLNDGTVEGFACTDVPAFAVQHHPEAGPGPHDSRYLFERFADLMDGHSRMTRRISVQAGCDGAGLLPEVVADTVDDRGLDLVAEQRDAHLELAADRAHGVVAHWLAVASRRRCPQQPGRLVRLERHLRGAVGQVPAGLLDPRDVVGVDEPVPPPWAGRPTAPSAGAPPPGRRCG